MSTSNNDFKKNEVRRPNPEIAVSEVSALYSSLNFGKYNPDDLAGRKGLRIYEKMTKDEQVKAGIKFKRDAITSRGYFFDLAYAKDELPEKEIERRVKLFNKIIECVEGSFTDCLIKILSAMDSSMTAESKRYSSRSFINFLIYNIL